MATQKENKEQAPNFFDDFDGEKRDLMAPFVKVVLGQDIAGKILRHCEVLNTDTGEMLPGIEFEALTNVPIYVKGKEEGGRAEIGQTLKWAVPRILKPVLEAPLGSKFCARPTGKTKVKKGTAWNFDLKLKEAKASNAV